MNIAITAGGTSEHIDAVRAITNTGTGTLAALIVNTFINNYIDKIDKIFYIHTTKAKLPETNDKIIFIPVEDTNSVKNAVEKVLTENKIDYFIHAMAISDYYVDFVTSAERIKEVVDAQSYNTVNDFYIQIESTKMDNSKKLSSNEDNLVVMLRKTPKIIGLIKKVSPNIHLIGFKLLNNVTTDELINVAYNLLNKNSCDYVVANDSTKITSNYHEAHIVDKDKNYKTVTSNESIANELGKIIFNN